jgi:hypothetical protein
MNEDMTPGEIARTLERIEAGQLQHGIKLDEIKEQTTRTNGRVDRLEDRAEHHARELGQLNSAVFPRSASHAPAPTPAPPVESGEFLSVRLSPKVWAAIYAAAGALGVLIIRWLEQRMGGQ